MDVSKIRIKGIDYDVKDVIARGTLSPAQINQIQNIMKYGVADISGLTPEQLAQLAANMQMYGMPDISGLTAEQLAQILENMSKYGIPDITGLTPEQLAILEAAHAAANGGAETDPIFNAHIAHKLKAEVASGTETLVLIDQ